MKVTPPRPIQGKELEAIRQKIDRDNAFIFVHVPKTAGTSIIKWQNREMLMHLPLYLPTMPDQINRHYRPETRTPIPRLINESSRHILDAAYQNSDIVRRLSPVTISVVRNPYDWLTSLCRHDFESDGWRSINNAMGNPDSYYYFLERFFSHQKIYTSSSDDWNAWCWRSTTSSGDIKNIDLTTTKHDYWCYRKFSYWQTFDPIDTPGKKKNHADVYIRFEYLKEGLFSLFGNRVKSLLWENKSNRSAGGYKNMYASPMSKKIVSHHREQELKLFGYDFNGPTDNHPLIVPTAPYTVQ